VPKDSGVEIEATVDNGDIGFIKEGREVEIKVETFLFTRHGLLHGKVLHVSRDVTVCLRLIQPPESSKTLPQTRPSRRPPLRGQDQLRPRRHHS